MFANVLCIYTSGQASQLKQCPIVPPMNYAGFVPRRCTCTCSLGVDIVNCSIMLCIPKGFGTTATILFLFKLNHNMLVSTQLHIKHNKLCISYLITDFLTIQRGEAGLSHLGPQWRTIPHCNCQFLLLLSLPRNR